MLLLKFSHPEEFICSDMRNQVMAKGKGMYQRSCDHSKHIKNHYPSLTIKWVCGVCGYVGRM